MVVFSLGIFQARDQLLSPGVGGSLGHLGEMEGLVYSH